MADSLPVLASVFGEENAEACFGLVRAFFEKPPLFGPRAVFLVYAPGTIDDPAGLCRSLEAEAAAALPDCGSTSFRAVMKGDPGFEEIAKDVLWFDLETGEAFPPEPRKLGFKNAKAAAPAAPARPQGAPPPGIGLDDNDIPTLVIGNPDRRKEKKNPIPVAQIVKGVAGVVAIAVAAWYAIDFFKSREEAEVNKKQAAQARRLERERKRAAEDAAREEARKEAAAKKAKAAAEAEQARAAEEEKARAAEEEKAAQGQTAQEDGGGAAGEKSRQNPFPEGKGPRLFSDLTDALGTKPFSWMDGVPAGDRPDALPAGSVWWCVFPDDPANRHAKPTILRITAGEDKPKAITVIVDGKEGHNLKYADFKKLRASTPHVELFEESGYVCGAPDKVFRQEYEPPYNASFCAAKIDLGEGLYAVLRSAGSGTKSKTGELEWDVTFKYCDPKPLGFTATFDRDVTYRDVLTAIRDFRDGVLRDLRDQEKPADGADPAQQAGGQSRKPAQTRSNTSFSGGPARHKSGAGFGGSKSGFGGARSGFGGGRRGSSGMRPSGRTGLGAGTSTVASGGAKTPAKQDAAGAQAAKPKTSLQLAEENASSTAIERDILAGKITFKRRVPGGR